MTDGKAKAPAGQRFCPSLGPECSDFQPGVRWLRTFRRLSRGSGSLPPSQPCSCCLAEPGPWPGIQILSLLRVPAQWYPRKPPQRTVESRGGGRSELPSGLLYNHGNDPWRPHCPRVVKVLATATPPHPPALLSSVLVDTDLTVC